MTKQGIRIMLAELRIVERRAKAVLERHSEGSRELDPLDGNKDTAALRRASMELQNALVQMRR